MIDNIFIEKLKKELKMNNEIIKNKNDFDVVRKELNEFVKKESVNHPEHYGGENNPYEAIKVIEAWDLGFNLGNTIKYISRSGKKVGANYLDDLKKAAWYLNREIQKLSK